MGVWVRVGGRVRLCLVGVEAERRDGDAHVVARGVVRGEVLPVLARGAAEGGPQPRDLVGLGLGLGLG